MMSGSLLACNSGSNGDTNPSGAEEIVNPTPAPSPAPSPEEASPVPTPTPTPGEATPSPTPEVASTDFKVIIHDQSESDAANYYTDKTKSRSYKVVEIKNESGQLTINKISIPKLSKVVDDAKFVPAGKTVCGSGVKLSSKDSCILVLNADGTISNQNADMKIETNAGEKVLNLQVRDDVYMTGLDTSSDKKHRSLARWDGASWGFSEIDVSANPSALDFYDIQSNYHFLSSLIVSSDGSLVTSREACITMVAGQEINCDQNMDIVNSGAESGFLQFSEDQEVKYGRERDFYLVQETTSGIFLPDGTYAYSDGNPADLRELLISTGEKECIVIRYNGLFDFMDGLRAEDCYSDAVQNKYKDIIYYGQLNYASQLAMANSQDGNLVVIVDDNSYSVLTRESSSPEQKRLEFQSVELTKTRSGDIYLAGIDYSNVAYQDSYADNGTHSSVFECEAGFSYGYDNLQVVVNKFDDNGLKPVTYYIIPAVSGWLYTLENFYYDARFNVFNLAVAPDLTIVAK